MEKRQKWFANAKMYSVYHLPGVIEQSGNYAGVLESDRFFKRLEGTK